MPKRYDVKFSPALEPYVEELLKMPHIQKLLAFHGFKNDKQGVARLALKLLLSDNDIGPTRKPYSHNDSIDG